ncbi:hypothetical protein LSAT2_016118 [Lamellibrachia satsuma]|nr:hypothetical protein LSAT2_016118 [Lamellibrachia satsuma]
MHRVQNRGRPQLTKDVSVGTMSTVRSATGEVYQIVAALATTKLDMALVLLAPPSDSNMWKISQGKLLKYAPAELSRHIADMFNEVFEKHILLEVDTWVLQKPDKPLGPLKSLRPIVLLTILRQTLSLITLHRIADKVNYFFSPIRSGFRRRRSTADVVWGHRWLVAMWHRHKLMVRPMLQASYI